jgi:Uma2 family endonuclease
MTSASPKRKPAPELAEICALPLVLRLRPVLELTEDQFFALCQINHELRIERNAEGEMLLMPPAGSDSGRGELGASAQLWVWAQRDGTGVAFGSSAGFRLPNNAVRSPDASWILRSRYEAVPVEQRRVFAPICPDFVLELRSPTDRLAVLQAKMVEYLANGARLGWLIDPDPRRVYVYRPDASVERLEQPQTLSGDPVLPGFVLDLASVW